MAEYVLYGAAGKASIAPQIVLEELGVAYRYVVVDLSGGEHRSPQYLRFNPRGRVPTLLDDDLAISESAAICLHLADKHTEPSLIAPVGAPDRARAYQWLLFLSNTVQPTLMEYFYPGRVAADSSGEAFVMANALTKLASLWTLLDDELRGRTTVVPGGFGVCDIYLYMLATWHRDEQRPLASYEHLWRVVTGAAVRSSIRRVVASTRGGSSGWRAAVVGLDSEVTFLEDA